MEITEIKIVPCDKGQLRGYITITMDNCFVISELKLIRSKKGYFVHMPQKKRADGTYLDIVAPITAEARKMLEERVLAEYEKIAGEPVKRREVKQ